MCLKACFVSGNGDLIVKGSLFHATEPRYLKVRLPAPVLGKGGLTLP